jgi:hypothetical protein
VRALYGAWFPAVPRWSGVCFLLTVEVSGSAKLRDMGPLTDGARSVGITLPNVSAKFYNLRPGMYCEFKIIFPGKQDIIESDEVDAIIARQKKLEKIDKVEFEKIRQWYEVRKEIYQRGKADPKFKVPEHVRKIFEEPTDRQRELIAIIEGK